MIGATLLMRAVPSAGLPARLVIAAGTDYQVHVLDARPFGPWSEESKLQINKEARLIVYHHTASRAPVFERVNDQLASLQLLAKESPYGLPYNFIVIPAKPWRIFYLNDVDKCWPHTYNYNCATAIAALGNYETSEPPAVLSQRMGKLADALATMWGQYVPEKLHRDLGPTACPGQYLSARLFHERLEMPF